MAALVILEAGTEEQKRSFLPAIASGERTFALAVTEQDYGWGADFVQMEAREHAGGYVLNGMKVFVHDADLATDLIVGVRIDGRLALAVVDAKVEGVVARPLAGFANGLSEVRFQDVRLSGDAVIGEPTVDALGPLDRALTKAGLIVSAYQIGSLAAVFDMSLLYSQTRRQFQQPIGRFQRVQDHVIDIVNQLDAARWTTNEALWKMDEGREGAIAAAHTAIVVAKEAHYYGCNSAHDVHAGIGIVREYGLTLHTKMSRTLYHYLGAPRYHRKKLAQALAL
jgi:alkylation response protein AidB-like acyl-CoA dehydrogenase